MLVLHKSMHTMHKDAERIPEYINALEDAQKRSKRAGANDAFSNNYLAIIATAAMLATHQYEPTNLKWEDLRDKEKTWAL